MGAKKRLPIRDARSRTNPVSEFVGHPHEPRMRQESRNKATAGKLSCMIRKCRDNDLTRPVSILRRHQGEVLQ
jgi:hypothetical protein